MSVPAIALYASPPGNVCSASHHGCQVTAHGSADYDPLGSRPSTSTGGASPGTQKQIAGGLSCLFSSPSVRHASAVSSCFAGGDDLSSIWHDRGDELGSSFSYSSHPASFKYRDQSPVSVFQAAVSGGSSCSTLAVGSSRSPQSLKIARDWSYSDLRMGRDKLFKSFVTNALGSCLDYESPSSPIAGGTALDVVEFSFNMEDSFDESSDPYAKKLLAGAQSRHKMFHEEFVVKAFYEAEKAHRGQMRASGDPYLQHCVETAVLLASIGANSTVVAAGLLHDTLDDTFVTYDYIFRMFGTKVADLVLEVSKLSHLSKLARDNNTASKTAEADRLHTMFLAMADARAVLIKLADRLHNMMTLDALPLIKQHRFAKETLEIFTPLANRLGISNWKEQLENLCFKHLYPQKHRELSSMILKSFDEARISSAKGKLEMALNDRGISYHVLSGRHKSLYSIHSKMLKKKLTMNEIHDIHGLRLIVEKDDECFQALELVHTLWPKVMGKVKDYINHPKFNGYQSLHTVVMTEGMVPLEVQIRTKAMHAQAEFGFAAHWRYKEGDCMHSSFVLQMVEWARWVLTWQSEAMNKEQPASMGDGDSISPPCSFPSHTDGCPYSCIPRGGNDGPVFIIILENDKMSVQELPAKSTVMDLLEIVGRESSRWSRYGFPVKEELRPRLNHRPVGDPKQGLKMGDVVELTPAIPDKSLTECREEIQRMYNRGPTTHSSSGRWRS